MVLKGPHFLPIFLKKLLNLESFPNLTPILSNFKQILIILTVSGSHTCDAGNNYYFVKITENAANLANLP